jgi:hypothetical protein
MSHLKLIKIGSSGEHLPKDAPHWDAVFLPEHGLMFTATNVAEDVPQKACATACRSCTYAGFTDWDIPSIEQLQLLIDRTRHSPAINADYFRDIANDWYWSDTPAAWSSASAWVVSYYDGYVGDYHRNLQGFALAVRRAGQ